VQSRNSPVQIALEVESKVALVGPHASTQRNAGPSHDQITSPQKQSLREVLVTFLSSFPAHEAELTLGVKGPTTPAPPCYCPVALSLLLKQM